MSPFCSPPSSPPRKRQRLSSPTYEEQVADLTQEDLAAFDEIEARLSQETTSGQKVNSDEQIFEVRSGNTGSINWGQPQSSSQEPSSYPTYNSVKNGARLSDDPENPFVSHGFASASKVSLASPMSRLPIIGFASALAIPLVTDHHRSPSPEAPPPEPDYDSWFDTASIDLPVVFGVPAFRKASAASGFAKASSAAIIVPSEMALAKAKAKLDAWAKEPDAIDENATALFSTISQAANGRTGFQTAMDTHEAKSPKRLALSTLPNVLNTPDTPSPLGFSRPGPSKPIASSNPPQRPAAFKSPLHRTLHTPISGNLPGSPLNPLRPSVGFSTAAGNPHPLSATPITAPRPTHDAPTAFVTPMRAGTPASVLRTRPAKFITPFKQNMKPGEPGRRTLLQPGIGITPQKTSSTTHSRSSPALVTRPRASSNLPRKEFFLLAPSPGRQTLRSSGLQPQQYDDDDLESMGINISMLSQITPETALYFSFHTASSLPPSTQSEPSTVLGSAEALKELLNRGCTLATKPWVDNHWCLILWKLSGLVALDPDKEKIPEQKRWCWTEVIRQLLYRYERELNAGLRPPLRKIANQDAPAAFPMVLCISNIFWSAGGMTEDGLPIEPHPELEVTDGWYRLRAEVDLPMARAVRKGIIRVGRKIGVAGAKLSTEKKDPSEVLEAYNSTKLILSGNSSHLMPWHTKLGFTRGPCVSTLHSLTPDGGVVAALDVVIIKVHPIAFFEFFEDEDGQRRREGPMNEAEELRVNEQWKRKRELQASKLREDVDKKYRLYDTYIHRLETKAGSHFRPKEDEDPPEEIDALYEQLEYPDTAANLISQITPIAAGWLARHARKQTDAAREAMADEIEKDLQILCPPRNVRSFRVLVVQDAQTLRKPANRTAQLTVWDVLSLEMEEGGQAGSFTNGQRYMATHLNPSQMSAWMDCEPGSEVYLSSTRYTRWTRIKTTTA